MAWSDESQSLHVRVRAFVTASCQGRPVPESFDALAIDLVRFQARFIPGYARLCRSSDIDLDHISRSSQAPAVPSSVFKWVRVATFPQGEEEKQFQTSGTTLGACGTHWIREIATYQQASVAWARIALALRGRLPILVLGPSPEEAPHSSLAYMFGLFVQAFSLPVPSEEIYFVRGNALCLEALQRRILQCVDEEHLACLVLGTSFAFVHALDALGSKRCPLPPGSRIIHTGGFKGKSREVPLGELRSRMASTFCIDEKAIGMEYGMTELSSQFYESILRNQIAPWGIYEEPPWTNVIPVHPETLIPVEEGEIGIARIEDLLNVDSAFAILVPDRVRRVKGGGFELLGRFPGAPPRGCSIGMDELLQR
ncbi:hypothetical protein [Pajaroellobacter abortibovis]|uniref:Acyl-protein synthetase LuxE domain-containing protein n=1 Tax=Pajaroellobacter abortibovis TaxID=1882918 RepID=A0A1L6MYF0_9BACT|nr:hypothetical protein [Pajaroellobacter abortibovis]APS00477.1 hypothetical protein BCY86_07155 [Pajaroellobacter abortibovis]